MANLADDIEQFLKHLMGDTGVAEVQRATLAAQFGCAPSQINYVMATRFTPERGYIVESRRGGGGYIRITRLNLEAGHLSFSSWIRFSPRSVIPAARTWRISSTVRV
ncbi:MAG TPA: CtsR family transcriptional regulator, partial [Symbiobacteriaceae bacterium]|nr:CtsR family transcriptional regulator [Symbiobacteriaceae bacterium]